MFRDSISSIKNVIVVMTPWADPLPCKRAWCVYEMYCAISTRSNLSILIPREEKDSFRSAISDNFWSLIRLLQVIDVAASHASIEEDERNIHSTVQSHVEGGFTTVNNTLRLHLRSQLLKLCETMAQEAFEATQANVTMLTSAGYCLFQFSRYECALLLAKRSITICSLLQSQSHASDEEGNTSQGLLLPVPRKQ